MGKLEAGSGPLGTGLIDLEPRKREICRLDQNKPLHHNKDILDKLRLDGVYVEDPEVKQKYNDINVQKLEERLLNNGQSEYFKINGDLKLDNDLLADEITRPADLAFESTTAFQKKEVNAILSDRMHSYKKRYYRLDIIVGKVNLFNCMKYFNEEDKLALKMREQFKEYETRVSLAMIPFYRERLDFIIQEIEERKLQKITKEDLQFLEKNRDDVQRKYE